MRAFKELHLQLSGEQQRLLEDWLLEFERDWTPDKLSQWQQRLQSCPPEFGEAAMAELVKIDLERAWKSGRRDTLSEYLARYPRLGTRTTVPLELIQTEIEVRRQFGAPVGRDYLAQQYPGRDEEVLPLLDASPTQRRVAETSHALDETLIGAVAIESSDVAPKVGDEPPRQFGRYRILKTLGRGGMGSVYLAEDTVLNRQCALKMPHFEKKRDREILERFHREAQAAARLKHPNICAIYDVGDIQGAHFISMEYVEGRPLTDFISPRKPGRQRATVQLIHKLAVALAHAHQHQIVHRDLKPANIMIKENRQPVVMDFGLACSLETSDKSRATTEGTILGTPAYMSPEQVLGKIREVGPPSDVYSLGVILFEMLTGRTPFQGSVNAILGQIIGQEPPRPRELRHDIDSDLESICLKMMAKQPGDRFQSMSEVEQALMDWLRRVNAGVDGAETMQGLVPVQPIASLATKAPVARTTAPHSPPTVAFPRLEGVDPKAQTLLTPPSIKRDRKRRQSGTVGWWVAGGLLGGIGLLWGIIIILTTGNGTLRIKVNDEDLEVAVNGDEVRFTDLRGEMDLDDGGHDLKIMVEGVEVPIGEAFTLTTREHEGEYRLVVQLGDTEISDESFTFNRDGETALTVDLEKVEEGVQELANSELALASVVSVCVAMDNRSPLGVVTRDGIATVLPGGFTDVMVTSADGWSGPGTVGTRAPFPFCWVDVPDHNLPLVEPVPAERESVPQPAFLVRRAETEASVEVAAGTFAGDGTFDFEGAEDYRPNSGGVIAVGPVFDSEDRCLGYAIRHDLGEPIRVYPLRREDGEPAPAALDNNIPQTTRDEPELLKTFLVAGYSMDAAVTADGLRAASVDLDGKVTLWDLASETATSIGQHQGRVDQIALSRDGRFAVTGGSADNGAFRVWDTLAATAITPDIALGDGWLDVALSADDRSLFVAGNSSVRVYQQAADAAGWSASDFTQPVEVVDGHAPVVACPTDANCAFFRAGDDSGDIVLWDFAADSERLRFPASGQPENGMVDIHGLAVSADGSRLLTRNGTSKILAWDARTAELLQSITHPGQPYLGSMALGPDGTTALIAKSSVLVEYWDLTRNEVIRELPIEIHRAVFLPDGDAFLLCTRDGMQLLRLPTRAMGVASDAPPLAVAPFDADQAAEHQRLWAEHLGVPVHYTNSIGMEFVLIPPGTFLMGSPDSEPGRADDEGPQHQVTITKPFYMGVTEVTQSEYESVSGTNPSVFSPNGSQSAEVSGVDTSSFPVECISWHMAGDYCRLLSELSEESLAGCLYRLPSEAEWEYACRAGTTTPFSDSTRTGQRSFVNSPYLTVPGAVGKGAANPWGLHDMHGRIWEWCSDWYGFYSGNVAIDPPGPLSADNDVKVLRGGWHEYGENDVGSAERNGMPSVGIDDIGFRALLEITPELIAELNRRAAADAPPLAVAPFDADEAAEHQRQWAEHLGVPVEYSNSIGMEFVLVPPGEYWMGSTVEEREQALILWPNWAPAALSDEEHMPVTIDQPYYIAIHETTVGDFREFTVAEDYQTLTESGLAPYWSGGGVTTGDRRFSWANTGMPQDDLHPVVSLYWGDAVAFCDWLAGQDGFRYRLPTETEWEYACRAGIETMFTCGDDPEALASVGNVFDGSFAAAFPADYQNSVASGTPISTSDGYVCTAPIGTFAANPWGLYDMHGNVSEWCLDCADASRRETYSAVRGGSWRQPPYTARSAYRGPAVREQASLWIGFRVVLEITPELIVELKGRAAADAPALNRNSIEESVRSN